MGLSGGNDICLFVCAIYLVLLCTEYRVVNASVD